MRTEQLFVFCLLVCQTTESLTDKPVNLGGNVTLNCQIGVRDIYWVFQKLTDSPRLILRTFSSEAASSYVQDPRLKDKYSSLTQSRLFIINITIHELGIYYCVKHATTTLQISNGTRLYINESAQDQNQTEEKHQIQSCEKTLEFPLILSVTSILLNFVLIIATIGLLVLKLKKPRKRRQQTLNVLPEQIEDLNNAQFSEVEFRLFHPNNTFVPFQKPKTKPRQI